MNTVLKELAPTTHKEYCLEKFGENENKNWEPKGANWTPNGHKLFDDKPVEPPKFTPKFSLFDKLVDRLDTLPYDHEAVQYVQSRNIPNDKWDRLYYIDNIKNIVQLNDKYTKSIVTEEPRLVIPFFDQDGMLMSVSLRAMRGETLRYILVKVKEDAPTVFGLDKVDSLVGGETAGIPFASFLASKLELPMHYVRKKPKGFGVNAHIEGCLLYTSPSPRDS